MTGKPRSVVVFGIEEHPAAMTPERWHQITEIFHAALARQPEGREVYLEEACRHDSTLRAEVDQLLAGHHGAGSSFGETPLGVAAGPVQRLEAGTSLGPYRIEALVGTGGMGEVYLARDTRLGRGVAVKVLGGTVAHDPQFRERFEREARAISALSHPHICTLFDVGHEGDVSYLVMELLEGETLAARLKRGALSPSEAFPIAIQVGGALAVAHRLGIIHRDLKPGNIMLTRVRDDRTGSPHAKLLDFGLARSSSRESGSTSTQVALTASGETVGTIPYMSPEQLEGRRLDARSDIWSFGCVLYEMFTGRRPFAGDSDARLMSDILTSEPRPMAPASLDRVVRKCLAKDPERRWQTTADLIDELQWISRQETGSSVAPVTSAAATERPRRWRGVALVAGALILAALAFGAGYLRRPLPPPTPVTSFDVPAPPGTTWGESLALSPDGRRLAFIAITADKSHVWIRDLDRRDARPLPGTDGATDALFWSPDSVAIGFFANGKLKTIRADGGPVSELADAPRPGGGTWNRDGVIVYSPDLSTTSKTKGLWRVPASGGKAISLTTPDDETHRAPVFLPDGRHLLYVRGATGVFAASLDDPSQRSEVLGEVTAVAFVAPGYLVFGRGNSILAQRFDPDNLTLLGDPEIKASGVDAPWFRLSLRALSATDGGVLAYRTAPSPVRQFVWVDRKGRELSRLGITGALQEPVLSPDERRVAFAMEQSGNIDIHVLEVASGVTHRVTFSEEREDFPVWSLDSQRVAFRRRARTSDVTQGVFEVRADGKGEKVLRTWDGDNGSTLYARSYTSDSRAIIYVDFPPSAAPNGGIYSRPLAGGPLRKWLDTPANEVNPRLSPDGKWMAYGSQEGYRQELYVQQYADPGAKAQVSEDGWEGLAEWRSDGQELFYSAPGGGLYAVPMKNGVRTGPKEFLFNLGALSFRSFSVTRDGQRFLVNKAASGSDEGTIVVVTNWLALGRK